MLCIDDLMNALRNLRIQAGSLLFFEAPSLKHTDLETGFDGFTAALQALVGNQGTLAVPTCTPAEGYPKPTFDPLLSPSEMGAFSEHFRLQPGVSRSHNPTHSVAAYGPEAQGMLSGHRSAGNRPTPWGDGAFGYGSPWDYLYERDAWWVLLDSPLEKSPFNAFLAALYAEQHLGITRRTPFPQFNPHHISQWLLEKNIIRSISLGSHRLILFSTRQAVDESLNALNIHPYDFDPAPEVKLWLDDVGYIKKEGYLKAGVAKVSITPPIPTRRWEGKLLSGVYRDLYARILYLSHGGQQVVFVLCDLLGISRELVGRMRSRVQALTGIRPETIQIACTHAHSTPDTIGAGYEDANYLDTLVETIAEGVQEAFLHPQDARLGWGRVPIRGLAQSRRKKLTDGKVFTTRYGVPSTWRVPPELIAGEGEIDPDLTVIRIEDLEGHVLAAISNFGCHASVALMSSQVSGDFPGEAMNILETVFNGTGIAFLTNGAAADVDPTLEMPYWGPRTDATARHLGTLFAAQVLECLERVEVDEIALLASAQVSITLPVRQNWFQLLEQDPDRMQQEFAQGWNQSSIVQRILQERVIQTEVQVLKLGRIFLVGFPGEIFAETGLELKASIPDRAVIALELANDDIGYIPPRHAFAEGGYEVAQNLWGRVEPEAAEQLLQVARRLICRVSQPAHEPIRQEN